MTDRADQDPRERFSLTGGEKTMPIFMDKTLTEYVDQAYDLSRLGRNAVHTTRHLVSAEMLGELEATGEAMRYVNCEGRIAWKATPSLRRYFKDLELDAQEDLKDL
jgi:hypothetical protein